MQSRHPISLQIGLQADVLSYMRRMADTDGTTMIQNIDATDSLYQIVDSKTRSHTTPITDRNAVKRFLPEYVGNTAFQPSDVGMEGHDVPECEWVNPPYDVDFLTTITRIISTIENCVLVRTPPDTTFENPHVSTTGFDGVIAGSLESLTESHPQGGLTVSAVHNLQVLYAKALLVVRYERETTDRVISDAPEYALKAIQRKMKSMKRDVARDMGNSERKATITVTNDDRQEIAIGSLNNSPSPLVR